MIQVIIGIILVTFISVCIVQYKKANKHRPLLNKLEEQKSKKKELELREKIVEEQKELNEVETKIQEKEKEV